MKELINEYQTVILSALATVFVFLCVYTIIPNLVSKLGYENIESLDVLEENNNDYSLKLVYPFGDRIRITKRQEFDIGKYILVSDNDENTISNYKYKLYVDGKEINEFLTDSCGGFHLIVEVSYKNKLLQGELLLIVEER